MPWNSDPYENYLEQITRENAEFTARLLAETEKDRAFMDAWLKETAADNDRLLDELLRQSATDLQTLTEATTVDTSGLTDPQN